MRYTSQTEETSIWIVLSAFWACISIVMWIVTCLSSSPAPTVPGANLALLAGLVAGVSLALRLPILTDAPLTTCFNNQIVWLLTTAANVNWFGYVCLRSESPIEVAPAAMLLFAGE